jgi:hypothetical protein
MLGIKSGLMDNPKKKKKKRSKPITEDEIKKGQNYSAPVIKRFLMKKLEEKQKLLEEIGDNYGKAKKK